MAPCKQACLQLEQRKESVIYIHSLRLFEQVVNMAPCKPPASWNRGYNLYFYLHNLRLFEQVVNMVPCKPVSRIRIFIFTI